jgi:hypothetical protein
VSTSLIVDRTSSVMPGENYDCYVFFFIGFFGLTRVNPSNP